MSAKLYVYVGPYAILPKDFDWHGFDEIIDDGRRDEGDNDEVLYLIPNKPLEPKARQMFWHRGADLRVMHISWANIARECRLFRQLAEPLWRHCEEHGVEIREGWGIVPCFA